MENRINPELLALLACPDCLASVSLRGESLYCAPCDKTYNLKNGIPLMYPSSMDMAHLEEETALSEVMKRDRSSPREQFILSQWKRSKEEFWNMVRENLGPDTKTMINIGCGFDDHFVPFQNQGITFVNFDMIFEMLLALQQKQGAESCVAGDVGALPLVPGSFDAVISIDLIHHESENLPKILSAFQRLLKPGGRLFLEDANAWGLFQFHKSILMPRPVYRFLRKAFHKIKGTSHKPADYEFPTNVKKVMTLLGELGFKNVTAHPHTAYPVIGPRRYALYKALSKSERVRTFHNYHYMLNAVNNPDR